MGLGDFLSNILGTQNNFQAKAPVNSFSASGPYGDAAQKAILAAQQNNAAQGQNIGQLVAQANGTGGPSVAQLLLQHATEQNAAGAASSAASQRGLNPALAQRLAVTGGANANQASAGQAAILRAQEQLAARQQLTQALAAQGSQAGSQASAYGGLDLGIQGINAGVAGQNAQLDLGAQQINSGVAAQNANTAAGLVGGMLGGIGSATFHGPSSGGPGGVGGGGLGSAGGGSSSFGLGEGGDAAALALAQGGKVPGRAAVPGNSPKNDTVPAELSPGEIVVPRSAATDPDRAAAFVRAVLAKQKAQGEPKGYGAVLAKQRELEKRLKALEGRR